jgi:PBSX family phage portal protein
MQSNEGKAKTVVVSKVERGEPIIPSTEISVEDFFSEYYVGGDKSKEIIKPPVDLVKLEAMALENNTLIPCIDIMEVNVDGTGHIIKPLDTEDTDDDLKDVLESYLKEPYPSETFLSIRKQLRRDTETTGNAYLEVIRNAQDEIVFFRRVEPNFMRLGVLSSPVNAVKEVTRGKATQKINMQVRERLYAYTNGVDSLRFYKEFNATRDLHNETGEWSKNGARLPARLRATEIIHFTGIKVSGTPYGLPRWITQTPSIIGSRKAEELNLEFFESGGIPPIMVLLSGGKFEENSRKAFEHSLSGKAKSKLSAAILEIYSTGGSLDKESTPNVKVERFGAEKQNDSMFENYDAKCDSRIRKSYRLPDIFFGAEGSYNYATAYASILVAEAQVFKPERDEFDTIINNTLMKSLDPEGKYCFSSKPLNISDLETKLKGLEMIKDLPLTDQEEYLQKVDELTGLNLTSSLLNTVDGLEEEAEEPKPNPNQEEELSDKDKVDWEDLAEKEKTLEELTAVVLDCASKDSPIPMKDVIAITRLGEDEAIRLNELLESEKVRLHG